MKITIAGLGYVGLSLACLFAKHNEVIAVDIDAARVDLINAGGSPIKDPDVEAFLKRSPGAVRATLDEQSAYRDADFILISTPTDYDEVTNYFNTSSIESVLESVVQANPTATVVIKSTVPVGFTESISRRYESLTILFSPEFLREGHALHDNLYPSRIVVGTPSAECEPIARRFATLLEEGADIDQIPLIVTGATEAEAIKLFANTYLALRVSFFNELDTYAESKGLDSRQIIDGVCLDPRIGDHYNNPSFGYGGYCLPKDSKQLLANYEEVPQNLIRAIVDSNSTRKEYIAHRILDLAPKTVGAYRLTMKTGSDNIRQNSTLDVVTSLQDHGIDVVIYEPSLEMDVIGGCKIIKSLDSFKKECDIILANRFSNELLDVESKVYTRDLWHRD